MNRNSCYRGTYTLNIIYYDYKKFEGEKMKSGWSYMDPNNFENHLN